MFTKFEPIRILELISVQVTFSIGLFFFLTIIDTTLLGLNIEFVYDSIVEPILSLKWNRNAQYVTPISIALMVTALFLKRKFLRITIMSIAVLAWLLVGGTIVVTKT